jgi:hypothetical protein
VLIAWLELTEVGLYLIHPRMIQEVITFMVAALQKTTADTLTVALMPFCQMFGQPPYRKQECHVLKNMS